MKRIFSVLKRDCFFELIGVVVGIVVGIVIYFVFNNLMISIAVGLICCILLVYVINRICLLHIVEYVEMTQKKCRYIIPEDIRGLDQQIDEIIDLDKELVEFLDKYASGKKMDLKEKELNKQWKEKGKYFVEKADKLFSAMDNEQLLESLLATEQICNIVDIFKYFKPFLIDVNYFLEHPEDLTKLYYETISNYNNLTKHVINPYYLKRLREQNYFEEIERFILDNMSNEQIMELANKSEYWVDKLYFYGFLKKDK